MKKIMFLAVMCVMTLVINAAPKLTQGNLDCLNGQEEFTVSLDLNKTVYNKNQTVDDFLKRYYRVRSWKEASIDAFVKEFNEKAKYNGIRATSKEGCKYEMQVVPGKLTKGGCFKDVTVNIIDTTSGETKAVMMLDSYDGDNDDEVPFEDTMDDLGEQLYKFMAPQVR